MDGSLFERGKALEDRFFGERDRQLLEQLRQEMSTKENVDALAAASGISDVAVLSALVQSGVTAETLTSVSLVPLVAVAWADGVIESSERDAILQAADSAGIESGSAGYSLMQEWLDENPSAELLGSWKLYIAALKASLDPAAFNHVRTTVVGRAKNVAQAAGGILGFGKTSASESRVLSELERAFE